MKNVYLMGKLNRGGCVNTWQVPGKLIDDALSCKAGDYAIVENLNDYDLVKIIGILVNTSDKYIHFIANGTPTKSVVKFVDRKDVRED